MALENLSADELDEWRAHPVTVAFLLSLDRRKKQREADMRQVSVDGTLDRVRRVSGALEEVEWVLNEANTEGVEK